MERVRRLCESLGLEFYVGPPRRDTYEDLKQAVLTPEERDAIPPHVDRALDPIITDSPREILREAAANLEKALDRMEEAAAAAGRETSARTPGGVPVEIARALDLTDDCTLEDALAAISGVEEYVPVRDIDGPEMLYVKRRALQPWVDTEGLVCILASNEVLVSIESTVPEGDFVIVDVSQFQPLHDELFLTTTASQGRDGLAVERVRKIGDKWMLVSGGPGRKPRTLTEKITLYGRVVWHGPANSRDLGMIHQSSRRDRNAIKSKIDELRHQLREGRLAAGKTSKSGKAEPATRRRAGTKK